jgi:FkbM family methyltransferase
MLQIRTDIDPISDIREIADLTAWEFEKVCRVYASNAYLGNNTLLCKILSKYKVYVDAQDLGVVPHLVMDGYWETWVTQCLARIITPGAVCIDIGANFGYFTVLMSELSGAKGRTVAIEPNPNICNFLRMSQSIHSSSFEIVEAALSNKRGRTTLAVPSTFPGSASITSFIQHYGKRHAKMKVKTLPLDELTLDLGLDKVDVIKMDVEGAEPLVFEGMQQTIARNPDLQIVMEYSPFAYADANGFTQYLFENFTVSRLKDVDEMTRLDESAIEQLVQLNDHTDLYLQGKNSQLDPLT